MKAYKRTTFINSTILNLESRWSWVVSFTRRLLDPQAKRSRYPGGTHRRMDDLEKGNCFVPAGYRSTIHQLTSPCPIQCADYVQTVSNDRRCDESNFISSSFHPGRSSVLSFRARVRDSSVLYSNQSLSGPNHLSVPREFIPKIT